MCEFIQQKLSEATYWGRRKPNPGQSNPVDPLRCVRSSRPACWPELTTGLYLLYVFFFLATQAALYLEIHWFMIHHWERSHPSGQIAFLPSFLTQAGWRSYEIRQPPTSLCTAASNFQYKYDHCNFWSSLIGRTFGFYLWKEIPQTGQRDGQDGKSVKVVHYPV